MATGTLNGAHEFLFRLQTLIADGGTDVLRNIFDQSLKNQPLNAFLANEKANIMSLRAKMIITSAQFDILYPKGGLLSNSKLFDITLIVCLLRNLPNLGLNQNYKWNIPPQPLDQSVEADLYRLKGFRNDLAHTFSPTGFTQSSFQTKWNEIEQVLLRLNSAVPKPLANFNQTIDSYKHSPIDPTAEKILQTTIDQWREIEKGMDADIKLIKRKMEDTDQRVEVEKKVNKMEEKPSQEEIEKLAYDKMKTIPDEITEDPYALNLYETALRDGTELDRSVRINIVGSFGQGKTSLVRRLLGKSIGDVESTDGIEVNNCRYHRSADGNVSLKKAQEKDTSDVVDRLVSVALSADRTLSQEQTSSITQSPKVLPTTETVHNTSGKDLQFQLDEKDNREGSSFKRNISTTNTEEECQVDSTEKENLDKNLKVVMFSEEEKAKFQNEVTKRKSKSLSQETRPSFYIWDFGGQYIFYATHTLFHSTHAVYLLVFDLSMTLGEVVIDKDFPGESSKNTMEYFIQFWMNSIHSFVGSKNGSEPKVILVGTHKDKIKGTAEDKREYIENYFSRIRSYFDGTAIINHFHEEDFAVDNTVANDKAIRELLETVISIGNDQSRMLSIPAKWIPLEKALIERKHIKVISFESVLAIDSANEIPLGDSEQVKLFLRYHHSKGTLIYFDEEPISKYVILDPQYLIDAFKSIITSERFCTRDPVIRPFWQMLLTEARLEQRLIDKQWKKDEDKMYMEHKEVLLAFLKKHHIISEATQFDEVTQQTVGLGWFVVPSLLKAQIPQSELCEFLTGKKQTVLRFVMMIDNSTIVPTVYHRLMAALIGKWPLIQYKKRNMTSQNQCFVRLNIDHAGVADMRHNSIELSVVYLCPSSNVESDQSDLFRRFSEEVIIHEFSKLHKQDDTRAKPYSRWYRCNHESHGVEGSNEIISADCFDERTSVPCPDLVSHEIQIKAKLEWTIDFREKFIINNPKLSDKILGHVSRCIGKNWQLLGLELGISQVQIEQITEDNPNSIVMRIYKMLKAWCCKMDDSADMNVLVQAMQKCDNVSIEWDEIRNIIDEMK